MDMAGALRMIFAENDGTNTLFRMFANANKNKSEIVCLDVDYVKGIYEVYQHFFYTLHEPEFISIEEFGIDEDVFRLKCKEFKTEGQSVEYKEYLKPWESERKYICGSFIDWNDWLKKNRWADSIEVLMDKFNAIRKGEVQSRSFDRETLDLVLELCKSHPDFIDIGDSRCGPHKTPKQLIKDFEYLRNAKLYVGMVGTWDRWAHVHNVPFVTMMEYKHVKLKSLHKLFFWPQHLNLDMDEQRKWSIDWDDPSKDKWNVNNS